MGNKKATKNYVTLKIRKETEEKLREFQTRPTDTDEKIILNMIKTLNSNKLKNRIDEKRLVEFLKKNNGQDTIEQIKELFKEKDSYDLKEFLENLKREGTIFEPKVGKIRLME